MNHPPYNNNFSKIDIHRRWCCLLIFFLLFALGSLFLITGALRHTTDNFHAMLGSAVWTTIGSHIVVINILSIIISTWGYFRGPKQLIIITLLCGLTATIGSVFIVTRITSAVEAAGGSTNFIRSLLLKPMMGNGPDEIVIVRKVHGKTLRAAIYKPPRKTFQAPVLFYVHGGGFMAGSFTETDADLRWFADQGWIVISVEYRLWREQEPTWDKAPEDIACAAIWIHNNSERYGGNPQRLVLLGDSAGGNLALNYAYATSAGKESTSCGVKLPRPNAVIVQYPVVDPLSFYDYGFSFSRHSPKMFISGYIGGSPHQLRNRTQTINSYTYLTANAPPTLIIAPEQDSLVPFWSLYRFANTASREGIDIELVRIPFANHAYNQLAANSLGNQARRSITQRYLVQKGLAPR